MVKCDEINAITRVVRVLIKNKITRLKIEKIKIVIKLPISIIRGEVR